MALLNLYLKLPTANFWAVGIVISTQLLDLPACCFNAPSHSIRLSRLRQLFRSFLRPARYLRNLYLRIARSFARRSLLFASTYSSLSSANSFTDTLSLADFQSRSTSLSSSLASFALGVPTRYCMFSSRICERTSSVGMPLSMTHTLRALP